MKKITLLMTSVVVAVTLNGCMKSPTGGLVAGEGNKPIEAVVPQDFDWKNTQDIVLSGNVGDTYAGRYLYRVDVFAENPIANPDARIIKGVSAKSSFTLSLTVPKGIQTLYVRQTDPRAKQVVQAVSVTGSQIGVSFVANVKSGVSAKGAMGKQADAIVVPSTPAGAEAVSGSQDITLKKGGVYVIPKGATYSGAFKFPGQGDFSLFVEGTWNFAQKNETLQEGAQIIVQPTGVVKSDLDTKLSFVNNASLKIAFGGTFEAENVELGISDSDCSILNAGNMTVDNIKFSNGAVLVNEGTIKIDGTLSSSNNTSMDNSGTIVAEEFNIVGGTINNYSMMEFDEFYTNNSNKVEFNNYATLLINEEADIKNATLNNYCYVKAADGSEITVQGAIINNGDNALFTCYDAEFKGGTAKVNIGSQSMFEVRNTIKMGANKNLITGKGRNNSLVRMHTVELKGWECVVYSNLEAEVFKHTANASAWDRTFVLEDDASMVTWGASTVVIPKNECSGEGNTPGSGSGSEGDQNDDVVYDQAYTYVMEDNWPYLGDYDMNDIVIELSNYVESVKNKTLTFNFKLLNAGATKRLGAGIQLDGIALGQVDRVVSTGGAIENDQNNVVIPLFNDAHALLGVPAGVPSGSGKSKDIKVEVTFKNAEDLAAFKISSLNLFITTEDKAAQGKRKEIHLCGYAPTNSMDMTLFNQGDDNSRDVYFKSASNYVWAIMIPTKFVYPKEGSSISLAYPDFTKWISSGGTQAPNWYENLDSKYTN